MNNQDVLIQNLENQVRQFVTADNNRPQGVLPSNMVFEHDRGTTLMLQTAKEKDDDTTKKKVKSGDLQKKEREDPDLSPNARKHILL